MKIENTVFSLPLNRQESWLKAIAGVFAERLGQDTYPLRFSIVDLTEEHVLIESTILRFASQHRYAKNLSTIEILEPRRKAFQARPFGVVQIIPTGIRCEFGGFAGDAAPVTNLLAAAVDFLVTHPNAVNASELNEMASNILYVEGKSLDDFLLGHLGLLPTQSNRVGTFIDPTGVAYLDDVVNTLNAARAVKGIDCSLYMILERELGVKIEWSQSGCAVGTIVDPEAILEAVELLDRAGG